MKVTWGFEGLVVVFVCFRFVFWIEKEALQHQLVELNQRWKEDEEGRAWGQEKKKIAVILTSESIPLFYVLQM